MPNKCQNCNHQRSAHVHDFDGEPVVNQCSLCDCPRYVPVQERAREIERELSEASALPINAWRNIAHDAAQLKGWWEDERTVGDIMALIHSEVSEVLEEHREGHEPAYVYQNKHNRREGFFLTPDANADCIDPNAKPLGIPIELADIIIKILDYCGKEDIDIQRAVAWKLRYNLGRDHKHGGKRI